ncbi:Mrp/NBP35 family ATP-binding protein [Peribacillus kribbensis]|uniref:Mrp/NBP35 family ATP-binding protein n=1 Tax=Peribacillus kribbensis TaxID=356658 RepID=UPI00041D9BA9
MISQNVIQIALMQIPIPGSESRPIWDLVKKLSISGLDAELQLIPPSSDPMVRSVLHDLVTKALKAEGAGNVRVIFHNPNEGVPELLREHSGTTFIAITSGKGGVGKSTVTINLAAALARTGKKVGVLDADIYGFSVPSMMDIEEKPFITDQMAFPVERDGVKIMSMGLFVKDNSPVVWRGPMLQKRIVQFLANTNWGELDYLLIDMPPGTGDAAMDIAAILPQAKEIIVTTPHSVASAVASRAGYMARHTEHEILGVIENMAYFEEKDGTRSYLFGRGGGELLASKLQTNVIARLPLTSFETYNGSSLYDEDSVVGELFSTLAEDLLFLDASS